MAQDIDHRQLRDHNDNSVRRTDVIRHGDKSLPACVHNRPGVNTMIMQSTVQQLFWGW